MIYHEKREDGKKIVARCENFLTYHNKLFQFLQDKVKAFVDDLLGEESVIFKEKINFKKSGGKGYTPHQDAPAFVKFGHKYHMSVLLPGDEMTQENGCIEISPGKYLNEMIEHPGGSIHQKYMKELESQKLYAIMKPGDLLAFDSYVPH